MRDLTADGLTFRPPTAAELAECALVWHQAVGEYMAGLNRPLPPPVVEPHVEQMGHLLATDPRKFVVAIRSSSSRRRPDHVAGFGVAAQRGHVWFLSELFVLPEEQGRGLGRALLAAILPGEGDAEGEPARDGNGATPAGSTGVLATATDSAQPVSNGLYGRLGIVPRMPVFNLVGRPAEPVGLPQLPAGVRAVPFGELDGPSSPDAAAWSGRASLVDAVDGVDRDVLGYAHPADHRFLRRSGRRGFLYLDASGEALGYGYASEVGRFGPVALLDETLTAPVVGHLLAAVRPRGAASAWVPGANDRAFVALLRAGLRVEGFPALLCWTRPFGRFDRYLPAGLALL